MAITRNRTTTTTAAKMPTVRAGMTKMMMIMTRTRANRPQVGGLARSRHASFYRLLSFALLFAILLLLTGCDRGLRYERAQGQPLLPIKSWRDGKPLSPRTTRSAANGGKFSTSPS